MQSKSICTRTGFHVAHAAWFCRHSVTFSATRVPFGHPTHACTLTPHTCTAHTRTDTHAPCRVHTQAHLDAHAHTPGLRTRHRPRQLPKRGNEYRAVSDKETRNRGRVARAPVRRETRPCAPVAAWAACSHPRPAALAQWASALQGCSCRRQARTSSHVFLTLMPSLPLLLRQELEFEDVTAVLHCVHSFLAAKVASVDPAFMDSQSSARKYTCSS